MNFDPYALVAEVFDDKAVYDLDINERLDALSNYPHWKQAVYLVLLSEGLIMNGGTPALFYNDGCIAPSVVKAYEFIGAMEHARKIRDLMNLFGIQYPLDLDKINELILDTPEQPWEDSTLFFFDNTNSNKIDDLLQNLILENCTD